MKLHCWDAADYWPIVRSKPTGLEVGEMCMLAIFTVCRVSCNLSRESHTSLVVTCRGLAQ